MDTLTPLKQETLSHPSPKKHWIHDMRQYGMAFIAAALPIFTFFSLYIFYRHGFYDLDIANMAFANTAAVLLGIVLLIGPLSRYFAFPDRFLQYRKELGIIAFFSALIHVIVSLFLLPNIFPFEAYKTTLYWPFVFGMIGITALAALFLISNDRAANAIGRKIWWAMQNWGVRIIFVLVFFHVYVMKWQGWLKWYAIGGDKKLAHPELPGGGILAGLFMAFVILIRLAEFGGPRFFRIAWYVITALFIVAYIATFAWGNQFAR